MPHQIEAGNDCRVMDWIVNIDRGNRARMSIISTIIAIIFILLGILHLYWAAGGKAGIAKVIPVVEGKPAFDPGKIMTLLVAFGLMGVGAVSYSLGHMNLESYPYGAFVSYAGWLLALVFLVRAVGDFRIVGFFKKHKDSEFAVYDTKYYSPFCLSLSVAFALLSGSQA